MVKMNRVSVDRSEKSKEIRVDFDLFMIPMIAEKARHRMAGILTFYQLLVTLALDEGFHFLAADVIAELFGGVLKK